MLQDYFSSSFLLCLASQVWIRQPHQLLEHCRCVHFIILHSSFFSSLWAVQHPSRGEDLTKCYPKIDPKLAKSMGWVVFKTCVDYQPKIVLSPDRMALSEQINCSLTPVRVSNGRSDCGLNRFRCSGAHTASLFGVFVFALGQWTSWAAKANPSMQVLIGLPAAPAAAGSGYVAPANLPAIMKQLATYHNFGGCAPFSVSFCPVLFYVSFLRFCQVFVTTQRRLSKPV